MAGVRYVVRIIKCSDDYILVRLSVEEGGVSECVGGAVLPDEGWCGEYSSLDEALEQLRRVLKGWRERLGG